MRYAGIPKLLASLIAKSAQNFCSLWDPIFRISTTWKNGHLPCWKKPSLLAVTSHLQRCWHLSVHHIETKAMYQHQAMIRKWPPMEPFGSTAIFRRICNCSKLGGAIISIYLQYLSIYLFIYLCMYFYTISLNIAIYIYVCVVSTWNISNNATISYKATKVQAATEIDRASPNSPGLETWNMCRSWPRQVCPLKS